MCGYHNRGPGVHEVVEENMHLQPNRDGDGDAHNLDNGDATAAAEAATPPAHDDDFEIVENIRETENRSPQTLRRRKKKLNS